MRFTCGPIIFYHSGLLDQPGVVEKPSECAGQRRRPNRLVVERSRLGQLDHRDLDKNTLPVTSYEDYTCCRVVVVDGVAVAADQDDDKILANIVG